MKRVFDFTAALAGLVVLSPLLLVIGVVIWLQDRRSAFYIANRIGIGGRPFRMVKFRSMIVGADRSGVDSTAGDDPRITRIGRWVRRYKLDELPQLWNVLRGEMSLVGPRPNVERETVLYTVEEQQLLSVRPGMTDLASIVFSDEAEILRGCADPDLQYNQVIRPWKSRLGLLYVRAPRRVALDVKLIVLTLASATDRRRALASLGELARTLGADPKLLEVVTRGQPLRAAPPPGAREVVQSRRVPQPG